MVKNKPKKKKKKKKRRRRGRRRGLKEKKRMAITPDVSSTKCHRKWWTDEACIYNSDVGTVVPRWDSDPRQFLSNSFNPGHSQNERLER